MIIASALAEITSCSKDNSVYGNRSTDLGNTHFAQRVMVGIRNVHILPHQLPHLCLYARTHMGETDVQMLFLNLGANGSGPSRTAHCHMLQGAGETVSSWLGARLHQLSCRSWTCCRSVAQHGVHFVTLWSELERVCMFLRAKRP